MDRITLRQFMSAARLIREPVIIVYTYPKNDLRYGQEIEVGVLRPMSAEMHVLDLGPHATVEQVAEIRRIWMEMSDERQ
jgi:hypothetical protein